jgi:hypothetical protein
MYYEPDFDSGIEPEKVKIMNKDLSFVRDFIYQVA